MCCEGCDLASVCCEGCDLAKGLVQGNAPTTPTRAATPRSVQPLSQVSVSDIVYCGEEARVCVCHPVTTAVVARMRVKSVMRGGRWYDVGFDGTPQMLHMDAASAIFHRRLADTDEKSVQAFLGGGACLHKYNCLSLALMSSRSPFISSHC